MTALALLFGAFTLWSVDPYGDKPYLPDEPPYQGVVTNALACAAAQGEIETISFSVQPARDMREVDFVPSDLTGPGGTAIPASAADFALVKVWYRADSRWWNSWAGGVGNPTLINNLILHDDDLVRVVESEDVAKRTNILRIDYPEGPAYVDMRKHGNAGSGFNHSLHPVRDAKKFVPFDLKKGRFQQYWFTWKVPADAKPGIYRGRLAVKEDGKALGDIPVEVEVYPFRLPSARTHYDTSQPYVSMWMGVPSLSGELSGSKQMDVAERKCRAIYRSCAEHNANCQGPGTFHEDSPDDLALRTLALMRQEGMSLRLMVNGRAWDSNFITLGPFHFKTPEEDPQRFFKATNDYTRMAMLQREILDKYLGHHNCYFASADECGTWFNRRSYPFWGILHKLGMEAWTDSGEPRDISWSVGMDDIPAAARHTSAWKWHSGGAKCVTYAGPFTGPADPDIWRRTKGLRYYYADFDGLHEYCFHTAENAWNDFSYRGAYSQFQFVYLTYDGLISTLAWEGVREALDDVRYLSLLRMRCEAALKSADPKVQALGRRHLVWMDSQDPEAIIDLFAFRREVARRAMELIRVVGPQPIDDAPPKPAPVFPPHSDDTAPVPPPAKRAARAEELEKRNRYDLAIDMWERVRADESQLADDRFEAAVHEANLQSAILRRDDAIRTIDATIPIRELKQAHRARLLLLRARVMMTTRIYEEEFTIEQLDEAAKVIGEDLRRPGASEQERYEAILKIADAYLGGYQPAKAIDFISARLKEVKLDNPEKRELYIREARAYTQLENWDEAARMYRISRKYGPMRGRRNLQDEGRVAEKRGDWRTAVICYSDEVLTYSDEEKSQKKACIRRLAAVQAKLEKQSSSSEITAIDDIDDGTIIKLEE